MERQVLLEIQVDPDLTEARVLQDQRDSWETRDPPETQVDLVLRA